MANQTVVVKVEEVEVRFYTQKGEEYFSLTDMAKKSSNRPEQVIQNWLRNRNTIEFLGLWEKLNNPSFNHLEFEVIKDKTGLNSFAISISDWAEKTNAIGIFAKAGRYNSGTFAHKDIAFEFGSWISPSFKLLFIREFQRLKAIESEQKQESLDWNLKRTFSKINYRIHSDAIKMYLIPPRLVQTKQEGIVYASEADMLNVALFGMTARHWQESNPTLKGNIRDYATAEQLLVLANLENLNAHLIKEGIKQPERLQKLNDVAIHQMELLSEPQVTKALKQIEKT